jgi:anti-sigma factor RsiW
VRSGTPTVIKNAFAREGNEDVAYWQTGGVAYALTGDADGAELGLAASRISKPLFQDQRKAG